MCNLTKDLLVKLLIRKRSQTLTFSLLHWNSWMRVIVSEELEIKNDSWFERWSIQKQLRDVNFEYWTNQLAIKDNLEAKHKAQRNQIFVNILSRAVNKKESLYFNQWKLATKFQNKRLFTLRRLLYLFEAKATKKSLNLWIKLIRNQKDFKTEEYISSCISSHGNII